MNRTCTGRSKVEQDLKQILDHAVEGLFLVGKNRDPVFLSKICEELYGFSREDILRNAFLKFEELEGRWKKVLECRNSDSFVEIEGAIETLLVSRNNGQQMWLEARYIPILGPDCDSIEFILGVLRDISALKISEKENKTSREDAHALREDLEADYNFSKIIGASSQITECLEYTAKVSKEETTVMLIGESGVGKELFARAIHFNSKRNGKPFVPVNCSAFPDTLIESELFGYEKGAFTGAETDKIGKVQMAEGGTFFLDEVTELSPQAQTKLLRLVQEQEFQPLGSEKILKADIRFIAATNQDPKTLVNQGCFREDLYFRLFVYPIFIPSLRQRKEDIILLAEHFLESLTKKMGKRNVQMTANAKKSLIEYSWPGNIRELQNVLERALILAKGGDIGEKHLPFQIRNEQDSSVEALLIDALPKGFSIEDYKNQWEKRVIQKAMKECSRNKAKAGRMLGLSRSALRYKLKKHKLLEDNETIEENTKQIE